MEDAIWPWIIVGIGGAVVVWELVKELAPKDDNGWVRWLGVMVGWTTFVVGVYLLERGLL